MPIWFLYLIAQTAAERQCERLERAAKEAVDAGRATDALQVCESMRRFLAIYGKLFGLQRWQNRYYKLLGDALFESEHYSEALYAYQQYLHKELSLPLPDSFIRLSPRADGSIFIFADPTYTFVMHRMGLAALRCGCLQEAVLWLQRYMASTPAEPEQEVVDALNEAYAKLNIQPQSL